MQEHSRDDGDETMRMIDAHCHIGTSVYGHSQTPGELIRRMDQYGIEKAVVFPFTPPDLDFARANDYIAGAVKNYPARLVGFARVDPRLVQNSTREIERAIADLKLRGVKMHPLEQAFQINSAHVRPVFEKCADLRVPAFVSAGHPLLSNAIQVGDLAEELPDLTMIMAHCGQLDTSGLGHFDALAALQENKNLYADTSGYPETMRSGFFENVLKSIGPNKLIFGSDSPPMHQQLELIRVTTTRMTDSEKEATLSGNIAQILRIS